MKKIIIMIITISMLLVSCSTPNTPSYDDIISTTPSSPSDDTKNTDSSNENSPTDNPSDDGSEDLPTNNSDDNNENTDSNDENPTTDNSNDDNGENSTSNDTMDNPSNDNENVNDDENSPTDDSNDNNENTPTSDDSTSSNTQPTQYIVIFDSNGGSSVAPQTVASNGHATQPTNPIKEGYVFDYWYNDNENVEYNFTTATINDNTTLHAKWICVSFELGSGKNVNDYNYKVNYGSHNWNNVPFATPTMTAGSYKLHVFRNENKIIFEYYKYNNTIDNLKVSNVSVNGNIVTIELVNNN